MTTQPGEQHDLHGSAPDTHKTALLLIDVINDFAFPRGDELLQQALPLAKNFATLRRRAEEAGVPVVYVNDNFGKWQSHFTHLLEHCLSDESPGREFVRQLIPSDQNYFILKPKHSAFYQSPLELLLKHLGTERLVLAGFSTNSCVLFTAADAYMRDLKLAVPADCAAACSCGEHDSAMEQMRTMLKADLSPSDKVEF